MSFVSVTFLLFLVAVFGAYWALRRRTAQNLLLVFASYGFYAWWDWRFCSLMLVSSLTDFFVGLALSRAERPAARRSLLTLSVLVNVGMLGFFKYAGFFADSFIELGSKLGLEMHPRTWSIVLPVGISFYTFQTMSYTIDVYRRRFPATGRLIDYMAYVSFFPQLVAGPIERARSLLPQFLADRRFDHELACDGLRQMFWGFLQKMLIADNLAIIVDAAYADPGEHSGPVLAFATVCFAFQIYCDFAGYSDIAIGTAKLFGIRLMRNFARPYFSQSVSEFWRRWHISLSTWFRDYVYIPLGGSKTPPLRRIWNVMLTFVISGFWHGASWNFVIWGAINGALIIPSMLAVNRSRRVISDVPGGDANVPSLGTVLRMLMTFAFICVTWVFFRAETLAEARLILTRIGADAISGPAYATLFSDWISEHTSTLALTAVFIVVEWIQRRRLHALELPAWPRPARWVLYTVLLYVLAYYGTQASGSFIYFQF